MDPITFDEIPFDRLEPGTFLEVRPKYRNIGLVPYPARALIVMHKLDGGTLAEGEVVQLTRRSDGAALAGSGSVGEEQVDAFLKANSKTPVYGVALGDADGAVKASGTVTFLGAVSASVVLRARIGNKQVRFTVLGSHDAADMASAFAASVNAENLTVTATAEAGVVTLTCRHGGELGNDIDIRMDVKAQLVPEGLTITIVGMSGGSGNPDIQDALDAIVGEWFTQIQMPWNDITNVDALAEELRIRYTATKKLDVHGFIGKNGTFGELSAYGDLTNSPFLTLVGVNNTPTPPWIISAAACGVATFHLTNDPARQLRSLPVPDFEAPNKEYHFTEDEQDFLLRHGISTFDHLSDGTTVISRMITTYKVSNLNVVDRAWMDIMTPATMSRVRYDWAAYTSLLYPRAKLVGDEETAAFLTKPSTGTTNEEDDQSESNAIVTPRRMHASWAARCKLYGKKVWLQDVERTVSQARFEIDDSDDDRMNAVQPMKIAGNLMVLAGALEFEV
ncbi:MAG: phage tail sheath subtilisin-like domain-containing protein [Cyanobacteria bacterium P01_A01_bin.17]